MRNNFERDSFDTSRCRKCKGIP